MAWDEKSIMDFLNGNNNQFDHFLNGETGVCSYSLQDIVFLIYWCVGDTCEIYQAREKYIAARAARKRQDANNSILVKAQGQLSAHNPTEALKTLWEYSISNTSQDGEYRNLQLKAEAMISSAEQTILEKEKQEYEDRKAKEEREYQDKRQEYNDNMRLKNRQIDITEKEIDNRRANQNDITNAVKSIALAYIDKSKRI